MAGGVPNHLLEYHSFNGQLLVWGPVVWIPGIPENERDWDSWVYPDSNPKPPGPKPTININ